MGKRIQRRMQRRLAWKMSVYLKAVANNLSGFKKPGAKKYN